jgi:hypothetical protein
VSLKSFAAEKGDVGSLQFGCHGESNSCDQKQPKMKMLKMFYLDVEKAEASFLLNNSALYTFKHQRTDCQTYMCAQSTYDCTSDGVCVCGRGGGGYSCEKKIKRIDEK